MLLDGRVALLSGVGTGLGREIARAFAREGAKLALVARSDGVIASLAKELAAAGHEVVPFVADACEVDDCERVVEQTMQTFGRLDVLVTIFYKGSDRKTLLECEPDLSNWRTIFDVNFFATLQMTKCVAHRMVDAGSGSIVMVNTMSSEKVHPGSAAYSGSKAALERAAKTLALELGPHGIRVNSVHPGYMLGEPVRALLHQRAIDHGTSPDEELGILARETALGYIPPVEEHVGTFLYLASDLSKPVTGQSIHVNAGHWLH